MKQVDGRMQGLTPTKVDDDWYVEKAAGKVDKKVKLDDLI